MDTERLKDFANWTAADYNPRKVDIEIEQMARELLELREENAKMAAMIVREGEKLGRLRWQPITPENLPKGFPHDECLHVDGYVSTLGEFPWQRTYERIHDLGYTHFRPINAPKEDADGTD